MNKSKHTRKMNYSREENYQPLPTMWTSPFGVSETQNVQPWTSPVEDIVNQEEALQALARDIHAEPMMQPMGRDGKAEQPMMLQPMRRPEFTSPALVRDNQAEDMMQPMGRDSQAGPMMMQRQRGPSQAVPTLQSLARDYHSEPGMQSVARHTNAESMMVDAVRGTSKAEPTLHLLGRNISAEATHFQGQLRVDIRQWTRDGERTRKGISLPLPCWQKLVAGKHQILDVVKRMRRKASVNEGYSLGGDVYVTIKSPLWLIDVRYWYKAEDGMLKPGRRGIALKFPEFFKLMEDASVIGKTLDSFPAQN